MSIIIFIVLAALAARFWYEWHSVTVMKRNMSPTQLANHEARMADRKARIIATGQQEFDEFKRQHPVLGTFRKYDGRSYWIKNATNFTRFP